MKSFLLKTRVFFPRVWKGWWGYCLTDNPYGPHQVLLEGVKQWLITVWACSSIGEQAPKAGDGCCCEWKSEFWVPLTSLMLPSEHWDDNMALPVFLESKWDRLSRKKVWDAEMRLQMLKLRCWIKRNRTNRMNRNIQEGICGWWLHPWN